MRVFIDGTLQPEEKLAFYCGSEELCLSAIGNHDTGTGACVQTILPPPPPPPFPAGCQPDCAAFAAQPGTQQGTPCSQCQAFPPVPNQRSILPFDRWSCHKTGQPATGMPCESGPTHY